MPNQRGCSPEPVLNAQHLLAWDVAASELLVLRTPIGHPLTVPARGQSRTSSEPHQGVSMGKKASGGSMRQPLTGFAQIQELLTQKHAHNNAWAGFHCFKATLFLIVIFPFLPLSRPFL